MKTVRLQVLVPVPGCREVQSKGWEAVLPHGSCLGCLLYSNTPKDGKELCHIKHLNKVLMWREDGMLG